MHWLTSSIVWMKHGFLRGFGDYKSKLLLLAEREHPTLAATLVTNGQHNCSLPVINTHPAIANTKFENEQLHTERDYTISCGVGAGTYEWAGVHQSDVIPSEHLLPKCVFRKCRECLSPVEPADPQSWIGISKQAIFLVVNNQSLCKNQLGGSYLFFESLEFIHLPLFVSKAGFKGPREKDLYFVPQMSCSRQGDKWSFIFVSFPLNSCGVLSRLSAFLQSGTGWDFRPERKLGGLWDICTLREAVVLWLVW